MSDWYYAKAGQQFGPISQMKIEEMARSGELHPTEDLVWTDSMSAWQAAGTVSGLFPDPSAQPATGSGASQPAASNPPPPPKSGAGPSPYTADPFLNPYAVSQSERNRAPAVVAPLESGEIEPGSEPIDVGQLVKRSFQLTIRHYGFIFLTFVVLFLISFGASFGIAALDSALGLAPVAPPPAEGAEAPAILSQQQSPAAGLVSFIFGTWLSIGMARIGLNLVSAQPLHLGLLFSDQSKILKVAVVSLLLNIMVVLGLILFIAPGIYLATRYGFAVVAIVDKDLGILEAFRYSSRLTTNNKLVIILTVIVSILLFLGGILAALVGLFIALPMTWLLSFLTYRWLQYGHRSVADGFQA
jgi:hypothetical protein